MTGLSWRLRPANSKKDGSLRRQSVDVGALFRQQEGNASTANVNESEAVTAAPQEPRPPTPKSTTTQETASRVSTSTLRPRPRKSEERTRSNRFSILKFRNASDPALGSKARAHEEIPPLPDPPRTPTIITTAPTFDIAAAPPLPQTKSTGDITELRTGSATGSRTNLSATLIAQSASISREQSVSPAPRPASAPRRESSKRNIGSNPSGRASRVTFDEPERTYPNNGSTQSFAPPPYDEHGLPIPQPRLSESSRSEASSADMVVTTTTTTHTVSTTSTFFRFSRRKKDTPLFPLPPKVSHTEPRVSTDAIGGGASSSNVSVRSRPSNTLSSAPATPRRVPTSDGMPIPATSALAASVLGTMGGSATLARANSTASTHSLRSTTSSPLAPQTRYNRARSSTAGSMDRSPADSARTSMAVGRNSFSRLFSSRSRQNSEANLPGMPTRTTSPAPYLARASTSHPNSMAVSREKLIIPERLDDDTPDQYLRKLEEAVNKSVVASLLSKTDDAFHVEVLKQYMSTFNFYRDPMDMALRKLLMEVELPKETQQIDRVLQAFADRYHECNPLIYSSSENAYFIAFSLLILHTDVFNKNNKHKMQKPDYVKNTSGEGITSDILEYFYDNISYTPFIHVEDDLDINGEKILSHMPRRNMLTKANTDLKKAREPVDPYTLIIDNKMDILRPSLSDVLMVDDPYSYLGTTHTMNMKELHESFFRSSVLQIVSARSRPDAFLNPATAQNPQDASPGVVEIKVTKIGLLWRKDPKKKKTRSPWQEWGALLTGSQLYFFKNVSWVKNLMSQYEQHVKAGNVGIIPCVFTPPLLEFNPDSMLSTDDTVALLDRTYKKHKNAFMFVRHGGFQEYFLADNEAEMNDWLSKLNYAAAFRTAGVRMRGVVGGHYDGQRSRGIRRMDSTNTKSVQTASGEVSIVSGRIDPQLAAQIAAARRQVIDRKIHDSNMKLKDALDQLAMLLRNAHHLKLLTPIQPKTRDAVILAAGSLNAKLQWVRVDIWRLRCHRDILELDLEEERRSAKDKLRRLTLLQTPPETPARGSKSPSLADSPLSAKSTPTQATVNASFNKPLFENEIVRQSTRTTTISRTASQSTARPSTLGSHQGWEIGQLPFELKRGSVVSDINGDIDLSQLGEPYITNTESREYVSITTSNSNEEIPRRPSNGSVISQQAIVQAIKPGGDPESEFLEQITAKDEKGKEVEDSASHREKKDKEKERKDEKEKDKVRRSLHRTLREGSQVIQLPHHRSRKGKDGNPQGEKVDGEVDGEKKESEGLARGAGSFTVHGKKASVITFGSDWHTIPAEDRLKRHRSAASTSLPSAVQGAVGDRVLDASSLGRVTVTETSTGDNSDNEDSGSGSGATSISRSQLSRGSSAVSGRLAVVNPDNEGEGTSATEEKETNDGEISIMTASAVTDDDVSSFIPDAITSPALSDATITRFGDTESSLKTTSREAEAVVVEIAKESDEKNIEEVIVLINSQGNLIDLPTTADDILAKPEPSVTVGASLDAGKPDEELNK
ncbi:hypothetical protein TWF706_010192 [Orbilia oligospora]|uniref:Guanyl-nucleotide exchange factor n=1 Tax=Orbilia oligospora TaxID=2813651 RepID=A0A7C8K1D7_ORBOL|nr:hypothetical protein TWF103_005124 [Orbilia oligospora]KAF3090041.1 hypothetical protein TWF706_010192 [Orbilia oligospora]KAF3144723.1 hypothetical protein TWF703_008710 [Orbilia oligospora]